MGNIKVRPDLFQDSIIITKGSEFFHISGPWKIWGRVISSGIGRRQIEVYCPACANCQTVFIWSFRGGGKFCKFCGVKMTAQGGFIAFNAISKELFEIISSKIKSQNENPN